MRLRLLSWVGLGLLALALFLRLDQTPNTPKNPGSHERQVATATTPLVPRVNSTTQPAHGRFGYRLANTSKSIEQLARSETGILLENALLDTSEPVQLPIPDSLRSAGPPGGYIVQSRGPIDANFRAQMQTSGALVL